MGNVGSGKWGKTKKDKRKTEKAQRKVSPVSTPPAPKTIVEGFFVAAPHEMITRSINE